MQLTKLTLINFRAFSHAEFDFQPGMNLLVGINGAGKSSVLDSLRKLLSYSLPSFTQFDDKPIILTDDDIQKHETFLDLRLNLHVSNIPITCELRKTKSRTPKISIKPNKPSILNYLKKSERQAFVVYFSTNRSFPNQNKTPLAVTAFNKALDSRTLNIQDFTEWLWALQVQSLEDKNVNALHRLTVLNQAIAQFLEGWSNLQAIREPKPKLYIDKNGVTLDIQMLSDGERSVIALVFDLARRLIMANPHLENPLEQGEAVVLIDELDLHLHPSWQRTIVQQLTKTFPNCQFIATTHSPQIIGEVSPNSLNFVVRENGHVHVYSGTQGYGLDTSWILENLMGTPSRNPEVQKQINKIEDELEEGNLDPARLELEKLRTMIHGEDSEVARLEASINNLEALANEMD